MWTRAGSIEALMELHDAKVQRLAQLARERIVEVVPHAEEKLRAGWGLIGYNAPAYFAFIALQRDHVQIGFEWGVMLSDPDGLLEGTGSQVRYVSIHTASELRRRALAALIGAAAAIRPPPRARRGR